MRLWIGLSVFAAWFVSAVGCGDSMTGSTGGSGGDGQTSSGGSGGTAGTGAHSGSGTSSTGGSETTSSTMSTGPYCGDGQIDAGEQCDDGNINPFDGCNAACEIVLPLTGEKYIWKYVAVPGTQCMDGSTAGFGVSLNPDSKNVMIYLEGGGACFNDLCDFSAFSIPFVPPVDGIFNRANLTNPVGDWNMIYVPYCSGDIHGGAKDTLLGGKVRHFRGYTNITKYLEQWVATFGDAENVLLTGISAGGFGAGLNAAQVADAFGAGPQMTVIDDSGPPLDKDVIAPCLQQIFQGCVGARRHGARRLRG
ncbi:MAG: DUF4215 domain-containing protein [Polyangiaceae bacterium]|nr:DUF4215 domain-containing protein [Polyangiaceae bacterium]